MQSQSVLPFSPGVTTCSDQMAFHQQQTPDRNRRRLTRNSGPSSTSNSAHTAKSFGDCQTPSHSASRSPLDTTQKSVSPKQRRCVSKAFDEPSLRDAIVKFDSQIFASIWRQLKSEVVLPVRNSFLDSLPDQLDSKNEFAPNTQLVTDELPALNIEFDRCDCLLTTSDGKAIGVSREVVSESSRLLKLEFSCNKNVKIVQLPRRFDALVPVVAAIYQWEAGKFEATCAMLARVDLPLLFEIFETAVHLNVPFLIDSVGKQLQQRATPSTYIVAYHQLKVFCAKLAEQLWSKIVAEFYMVCLLRTHKLLSASELKQALFKERINVARGEELAILRTWARSNRQECQPVELQIMRRQLTDHLLGSMGRSRHQRLPYSVLFALGGWGAHGPTDRLEILNGYTENWIKPRASLGELTSPRCYYAAIPMPEVQHVYVMGGFDGTRYYEGSTRFNLETLVWDESSYSPLHECRCYVNAARLDAMHIVACGGYNNTTRLTSAEILNVQRNIWVPISSMNVVRSDAHAVELNGKVYVIGGFDGQSCHRSVEFYDPHHNQWSPLQRDMREKRSGVSALSMHGAIFAVGGFTGRHRLNTAEFWDPREGHWHFVSPMILNRSNFGISELRSNPVCVGGYDGHGTTELCERFEWRADKWVNLPSLHLRRSALSLFRVDNLNNIERLFSA